MDTYLYLLLTLILLILAGVIFLLRGDLRPKMLRAGILCGFAGILAELWYFRDYWRPPTVMGIAALSPEDVFIGVALGALGVSIYDAVMQTTDAHGKPQRQGMFLILFIAGLIALLLGSTVLGYTSVIVSEAAFVVCTTIMVSLRPDLLRVALLSGLLLGLLGFAVYLVLFTWLAPHYWHTYWLLEGTRLGITILDIPLTEIMWFMTWGMLAGVIPNFRTGMTKVPRQ